MLLILQTSAPLKVCNAFSSADVFQSCAKQHLLRHVIVWCLLCDSTEPCHSPYDLVDIMVMQHEFAE